MKQEDGHYARPTHFHMWKYKMMKQQRCPWAEGRQDRSGKSRPTHPNDSS